MKTEGYPNSVLYTTLKSCGISNRDAATVLLEDHATFGDYTTSELIDKKSQLSRRVVHAAPDSNLPAECFKDFTASVPTLASRVLERFAVERCKGDMSTAATMLIEGELAIGHANMAKALNEYGSNEASYREVISRIEQYNLDNPHHAVTLHLMALVVAGCTADGHPALANVISYALDELELDAFTAETGVYAPARSDDDGESSTAFGIVRVRDNIIETGSKFHRVGEDGLIIGLLPREEPAATDVDPDVSLRHARLWIEGGKLFIMDLGSTNGTSVISQGTKRLTLVAPPKGLRDRVIVQAVELHYGDFICLGATTQYIVLPGITSDSTLLA